MTLEEFENKMDSEVRQDYVVFIRQKYEKNAEWEYINELFMWESEEWIWSCDWNEGQKYVEILGYIAVNELPETVSIHAKWIWDKSVFMYVCSNCNESPTRFTGHDLNRAVLNRYYHYCRNCGAKMDLKERE